MNRYIQEHTRWQHRKLGRFIKVSLIILLPLLFLFFFILLPGYWAKNHFDLSIGLGRPVSLIIGIPIFGLSLLLYLWTIVLFAKARGTQVPMAPTQELVTEGPYTVSRNPMMTSALFMVIGLGISFDSWSFILIGAIPFFIYLVYIRFVEEKELEARFDQDYRSYKKNTPFILPKLFRKKRSVNE